MDSEYYRDLEHLGVREVTHRCPPKGTDVTPCCGLSPFELSQFDRLTVDPDLVSCAVEQGDQE